MTGDGREHLVTVPGVMTAEAGSAELCRADISMFFHRILPGLDGIPSGVSGLGSGSMVMAAQIQSALRRGAPLLIFDVDRSATNLLVPGCATSDGVTPLVTLLARRRSELCGTALLFAASALDILTEQADRILCLNRHEAGAVTLGAFQERLEVYLGEVLNELKERRAHAAGPVYPEPQVHAQEKRPEE